MKGKNVLCHMVDQQPLSTPTAKVYNGGQRSEEVELYADQQRSSIWGGRRGGVGGSTAADSLAVVHGGSRGRCFA